MGDWFYHTKLAKELWRATLTEFKAGRFIAASSLAFRVVEQAIEAVASIEGHHFHLNPSKARIDRVKWFKEKLPDLAIDLTRLWRDYENLEGSEVNRGRIHEVLETAKKLVYSLEEYSGLRIIS